MLEQTHRWTRHGTKRGQIKLRQRHRRNYRANHRAELLEERRVLAAVPVISELMAINDSYLADASGRFDDWLELANFGDETASLNGWYLTDDATDLTKWQFPEFTLAPGEARVVFASGDDRRDADGTLHTNFKLDGGGEFLALVQADGTTIADAYQPAFPPQVSDVSFGLFGEERQVGYFPLPTPGTANVRPPDELPPQAIVVNEIMYHPASENDAEEFIELLNAGSAAVDVSGWRISGGIDIVLPDMTIEPGSMLVVTADPGTYLANYGAVDALAGPWTGQLSNSSNTVTLRDDSDRVVDRVRYADEGEWAQRGRGPDDGGHQGWVWLDDHDGGGRSLELINPRMPNEFGQNWAASLVDKGTPGATNSVAAAATAPIIVQTQQSPIIPRAADEVTIQARVIDETTDGVQVVLNWRVDGSPSFTQTPMSDDGQNGDLISGDRLYAGSIPAQVDRTVIEYYVSAVDASSLVRTWPAATADSGQVTNALYQVIDEFDPDAPWQPGSPPVFYQVMTAMERTEFTGITRSSNAQMNATFITVDGNGVKIRHNVGIRVRGSGSRSNTPPNNRVNLPTDRPWKGVTALNLNVGSIRNQIAGSTLFRLAGVSAADATGVVMFSNGVDLRSGQLYAHLEPLSRDYAENHYPDDDGGNLYKGRRPNESPRGGRGAGLAYWGPDPGAYVSYTKLTNENRTDWSDVIRLTDVLNNSPDESYLEQLAEVVDIDQWLRFFAMNALLSNTEGGLVNGDRLGDDYAMYSGVEDSRFQMIPHDLDSILSQRSRGIFLATRIPALDRFLLHPEILPRYYETLLNLIDDVLLAESTETAIRDSLQHVASSGQIDSVLTFLQRRSDFVRSVIPQSFSVETGLPKTNGRIETAEFAMGMWGTADYRANSVVVNGQPVPLDAVDKTWELGSSGSTVFPWSVEWQYLDDGSDQGKAWYEPDFVANPPWRTGLAELGYGDGGEATVIGFGGDPNNRFVTSYFRREFELADAARYAALVLQIVRDDGAVVYLNGQEIVRNNLPASQDIDYETLATSNLSGGSERSILSFAIDPTLLVDGRNVLAVEVHQFSRDSADVSFRARLLSRFSPPNVGVPLLPGVNYVVVQSMSGPDGTGDVISTELVDVWRQTAATIVEGQLASGDTIWNADGGPYQVRGQLVVPEDAKLTIEPGTSVYFEAESELLVRGVLVARGSDQARIRFTSVPGEPDVPNLPGLPDGPARWNGIQFVGSTSDENVIAYADIEFAQHLNGSIGVRRSTLLVDNATFRGTHLRMIYASNASLIVQNSRFPDMFGPDENPAELKLDNVAEHIKIVGRTPAGGQLIIQRNRFGTNKGHNDVIDADSNRFGGGPVLQVLDNIFMGAGDELLDLGGDVVVSGNLFRNVFKDDTTSDRGYANVISTGDAGSNTTIVVTRNIFYDVDHAINLKNGAATIFENNTVVKIHPDFEDRFGNPNVGSAINLFVDEPGAVPGRGAYAAGNIFWDAPRVFGNVDLPGDQVSALQLFDNLLGPEQVLDGVGGREGTILDLGTGNVVEDPRLVDPDSLDFSARPASAALAPSLPIPWGANVSADAWIAGVPMSPSAQRNVSLTVGGPGLFAFRYRVNGGDWSEELPIGNGFDPNGTIRTAPIQLDGLADGEYSVEVEGRDAAGNWQSSPTVSESWSVAGGLSRILISEVLASNENVLINAGARPDLIELYNAGVSDVDLSGMTLTDNSLRPDKFTFGDGVVLPAGQYLTLLADDRATAGIHVGFSLSREGEGVYLFDASGQLADSVEFGMQVTDFSIGRVGVDGAWQLTQPTFGAANIPARTGDVQSLKINEWLAESTTGGDFVELFNPDPVPVNLSGLWLSDAGDATPGLHAIPPLSFVAASAMAVFQADADPGDGPDHLNFRLSNYRETLRLSDIDLAPIDTVVYGPQTNGFSQGRTPDGAPAIEFFALPSPGWANGAGFPGDLSLDGQIDVDDVNLLCAGIRLANTDSALDLNRDDRVNFDDMSFLIEGLLATNFGDSNLDGLFDSSDLVLTFQAGQFEDGVPGNSTWRDGDWNCDGEFGTSDIVIAFRSGSFVSAATPALMGTPQTATIPLQQLAAARIELAFAAGETPKQSAHPFRAATDVKARPPAHQADIPAREQVFAEWQPATADESLPIDEDVRLRLGAPL